MDYGDVFEGLQSHSDLQQALHEISKPLGFQSFVYHVLRAPTGGQRVRLSGATKKVVSLLCDKQSGVYPEEVVGRLGRTTMPYRWVQFADADQEPGSLSRFFDASPDSGLNCGVTIPLHGPSGGVAALCFASNERPPAINGNWSYYRDDFILIGSYVQQVAQMDAFRSGENSPNLTGRESEVLLWTARGKTAWVVGEILEISEETVRFHLKNATRKFNVCSKHQAVVQAIICGLIVP